MKSLKVIDFHSHYKPQEFIDEAIKRGIFAFEEDSRGYRHIVNIAKDGKDRSLITVPELLTQMPDQQRIKRMDDAGVDIQVLSEARGSDYSLDLCRIINNKIAEAVKEYPTRFIGLASIPLMDMRSALEEIERAVTTLEMKGVCVSSNIGGMPLDSYELWPLYEKVCDIDIPIFVHPGRPVGVERMDAYYLGPILGFEFDLTLAATRLIYGGVLEDFPKLKFVFSHLGGAVPFLRERIEAGWGLAKFDPNHKSEIPKPPSEYLKLLYFDTVSFYEHALMCAYFCCGADKLVLGSDYPYAPLGNLPNCAKIIEKLRIPEKDKQKILGVNAAKLLRV